jgi:hypothetical protein
MSKQRTIIVLGVIVALIPYSGFPSSWKTIFFLLCGIGIVVLGYQLDKEIKRLNKDTEGGLTSFVDNRDIHENKN